MVIREYGDPQVFEMQDVDYDALGAQDVLVRIFSSSVNPVDWKVRRGYLQSRLPLTFPAILGWDAAGIIESVGTAVTKFRVGESVFTRPATDRPGTYAEFVVVHEDLVARKPANLTFLEAASIPLAGLTAWEALVEIANIQPGQTLLIHGASGGVGSYAVQLGRTLGATVFATASGVNHDYLKSLGARQVWDYQREKFEEHVKNLDVVLDTIGGETQVKSFPVIRPGGHLVSIASPPDEALASRHQVVGSWFFLEPDGGKLHRLGELFASGDMVPVVSQQFDLKDVALAQKVSETGHVRGKIAIRVRDREADER